MGKKVFVERGYFFKSSGRMGRAPAGDVQAARCMKAPAREPPGAGMQPGSVAKLYMRPGTKPLSARRAVPPRAASGLNDHNSLMRTDVP